MKAYLDPAEIAQMEESATNLRDRLLIRVLRHSGCRVSEALSLVTDDIDFDVGTITIQHLKSRTRLFCPQCGSSLSRSAIFCPRCAEKVGGPIAQQKEHRRVRTIPIDKTTLALFDQHIRSGGPVKKKGKYFVFGINRHRAWQIVKGCAERAGLPKLLNPETGRVRNVSPHRLRDAFAVHAMKIDDSGDGLRLLQEHLGHQSFDTTARYRKIAGEEQRQWYDRLWR